MTGQDGELSKNEREFAVVAGCEAEPYGTLARLFDLGDIGVVGAIKRVGPAQRVEGEDDRTWSVSPVVGCDELT